MRRFPRGVVLLVLPLVVGLVAACVGDDPVVSSSPETDGGSTAPGDGSASSDTSTTPPDSSSPIEAGPDSATPG
ncbi:MAG TPA: hypothetical protein VLT33_47560, partial [Labilithrix sp.]|nr:hypothetical protein [Labilithrix sp.]